MTVEQATCELMVRNVEELSCLTRDVDSSLKLHLYYEYEDKRILLDRESFDYDKLKIVVEDNQNRVVFRDNFSNYSPDFESQKEFMFNILKSLHIYHGECAEMVDEKICADNDYFFDVLGEGCTYKEVSLYVDFDKFELTEDEEYIDFECQAILDYITNEIKNNLDKKKIRVLSYEYGYTIELHISRVVYEEDLYVHCIDDEDMHLLKDIKSLNDLYHIPFVVVPVFYSPTTDKELERAAEFIKNLLNPKIKEN